MTDQGPDSYDPLDDDYRDQLVAIGKTAVSLIPLFGGPLAEIIGVAIPNQRADRVASYVRSLNNKIEELSEIIAAQLSSSAAKLDLIVEGGYQSARALSNERVEQITEAVARGLAEDDADILRRRRLLVMFGELDDDEVALLNAYGASYGGRDRNAFAKINRPEPVHMASPKEDVERDRLFSAGKEHLLRLSLLTRKYGSLKKGQSPEFDPRSGHFKHTVEISFLGRLLLEEVGLTSRDDAIA
jgi:outer membrane murein-binding lipoprotein Lpp